MRKRRLSRTLLASKAGFAAQYVHMSAEEEGCPFCIMFNILLLAAAAADSADYFRLVTIAAENIVTGKDGVVDQFLGFEKNRQYDASCRKDIRLNLSFETEYIKQSQRECAVWLRKRICETCGRVS